MLPPRSSLSRIPRPCRPSGAPNRRITQPKPTSRSQPQPRRTFTKNAALHVLAPVPIRPQLPFLSPSPANRALAPLSVHLRQHFARLLSTERRNYYKRQISGGLRLGLTGCVVLVLIQLIQEGMHQQTTEHRFPTPPEWSWRARWGLREALALQSADEQGVLTVNWVRVAGFLRGVVELLEDKEGDGKGIVELEGQEPGKEGSQTAAAFDISAKDEQWTRGYFQALMGAARAAENLEGWVTDWTTRLSAPKEYMEGPSNPRPKPMPAGKKNRKLVLREENCEPASPSPDVFYEKILATEGFGTGQKVEAALAYADWLDFKGLQQPARDMYRRAMDIAVDGLSPLSDARKNVVDIETGILKTTDATKDAIASENILRVSTAMAVHQARHGNLPDALSIFTSVLKARRSLLPPSPTPPSSPSPTDRNTEQAASPPPTPTRAIYDPFVSFFSTLKLMFTPVKYPPPPSSGNAPPRRSAASLCDEAGLMTYIGEIIFACSSLESGLAWTRDAVELAESALLRLPNPHPPATDNPARQRCKQCLKVGLDNWKTMVRQLVRKAQDDELACLQRANTNLTFAPAPLRWLLGRGRGVAGFGDPERHVRAAVMERSRWEAEEKILGDRIKRLLPLVDAD